MKTQEAVINPELVSALADGQLRGDEFANTVDYVGASEEARLTWQTYHLVGDVMRAHESMTVQGGSEFMARLRASLKQETPLRPDQPLSGSPDVHAVRGEIFSRVAAMQESANEGLFRWKLLAGVASVAAVSMIAWQAIGGAGLQMPQLASTNALTANPVAAVDMTTLPLAITPSDPAQVMIRDPQLDALLAAHKQFGGTSALQMPAGFLRNATFEGAVR